MQVTFDARPCTLSIAVIDLRHCHIAWMLQIIAPASRIVTAIL
jgi:hypothetical protein